MSHEWFVTQFVGKINPIADHRWDKLKDNINNC